MDANATVVTSTHTTDGGDFETVAQAMTTKEAQMQMDFGCQMQRTGTIRTSRISGNALQRSFQKSNSLQETSSYFLSLLAAITSVGHKPRINWRYAGSLAMHYFRTGEIGEQRLFPADDRGVTRKAENRQSNYRQSVQD